VRNLGDIFSFEVVSPTVVVVTIMLQE